jgi:uncharacterized protein (DUF433 family)
MGGAKGRWSMKLPEFLTEWPYGEIVLTGHRIGLLDVIPFYKEGFSPEQLHEQFPSVPLELINRVLAFYHENKEEVDAYVARCQAEIEHQRATTPRAVSFDELLRRYDAKKRAGNA